MDREVEGHFGDEQPRAFQESNLGPGAAAAAAAAQSAPNGCFDCNICLDFAVEPVVTLCGHLYCWPCIYKWLQLENTTTPQQCPVCKTTLSQTTLVPLYGRGHSSKGGRRTPDVPHRPPAAMMTALVSEPRSPGMAQQQRQHQFHHHHRDDNYTVTSSATAAAAAFHPTMLGGTAFAVLPWVFGDHWEGLYYSNPYHFIGSSGDTPRLRRQEMQAKRSLHRISVFCCCCVVLCLLLF